MDVPHTDTYTAVGNSLSTRDMSWLKLLGVLAPVAVLVSSVDAMRSYRLTRSPMFVAAKNVIGALLCVSLEFNEV